MSLSYMPFSIARRREKFNKHMSFEKPLLVTYGKIIQSIHYIHKKKETPLCASVRGSYTIEAAVVMPIVICLITFILFFLKILQIEYGVQSVLNETSQQVAAVSKNAEDLQLQDVIVICSARMATRGIPLESIRGNMTGMDFSDSGIKDNYISLRVTYDVEFPIKIFGNLRWHITQKAINRKWIGWDPEEGFERGAYVYVTESGEVYHTNINCAYLHPRITAINRKELKNSRNESGDKYTHCKLCKKNKHLRNVVYITNYGNVYHDTIGCSGLKRTIYRRKKEEVSDMRQCSKCSRN